MSKINRLVILIVSILAVALIVPSATWSHSTVRMLEARHNSKMSPVIWVPGSSANQDRYDPVFKQLNSGKTKHSVLKITVDTNNKVEYTGSIRPNDRQPFIVIAFQDNKDGYPTIKKQAKWFNVAFNELTNRYHFNNFSAVGHSNGGLVLSFFLEDYNKPSETRMTKLVTMGSPYNSYENSLSNKTVMLNDLIDGRSKIDKDLSVFSISGSETYSSDGIVPLQSVEAGKYVFQNQVKHYTQLTVTGSDTEHSDLPSNPQVLDIIRKNILDDKDRNMQQNNGQNVQHKNTPITNK